MGLDLDCTFILKNKTFAKLLKSTIFRNKKRSEDTIEDEKAYPLRRGTIL